VNRGDPGFHDFRHRRLVFRNDHDGRLGDREARPLIRRLLDAAGDHQTDVDTVLHTIGLEAIDQPRRQFILCQADIHVERLGAGPEAFQVFRQKGNPAIHDAQTFPHAIAQNIATVEDGDDRLVPLFQFAIHRNQYVRVARIGEVIVHAVRVFFHHASSFTRVRASQPAMSAAT
jgi:hypothetical protein